MRKTIHILILGADGQQGVIATRYLTLKGYNVACADIYTDNLMEEVLKLPVRPDIDICDHRDLTSLKALMRFHRPAVVLNCANDFYNDNVTAACLSTKVHCVDLGSDIAGTRRRLNRHKEFKAAGLTYIMGCGSVPGIGSVMLRRLAESFHRLETAEAGFAWDSNMPDFVPPFFLYVVLLELSRPADMMKDGKLTTVPPVRPQAKQLGVHPVDVGR